MSAELSRISVIVPVYNHEAYVAQALRSALDQSFPAHEILLVDDGSTDGSAAVAAGIPGVKVLRRPNGGIGAARNTGLRAATGDAFAFLDADDRWHPDKLRLQREALLCRPELDMVFSMARQFLSPDLSEAERAQRKVEQEVVPGRMAGTMLIRRGSFERVGEFRGDLRTAEFLDWYARAQALGLKDEMLPEVLYERRIHAANHGVRERGARGDYFRALKASIDLKRKAEAEGA